jgi:alkanesulfonate monooxygenase SsuD/methylene tetrahydromethanopterin reductase-like flavin-dependent oxidoreductase (luciferase family)
MGIKNLKVAVTAWNFKKGGLGANLAEQGEIAEHIGFDSFWLPESHFAGHTSIPSPLTQLAAIASRTSKIRLGTTSYLLPIRHPIQAAEEVAVLDQLSNGRVILGVGRGFQNAMFTAFEIPPRDKRKKFKANLQIMKDAWEGKSLAADENGEPIILAPLPVQKPYPPIWVAAFGPLAIKQAGSLGLPYIASPVETMQSLSENYLKHQAHAYEAGFGKIDTVPIMRTLYVSENKNLVATIRDNLQREASHRMRTDSSDAMDWTIVGDAGFVTDKIAQYQETLGLSHLIARGRIPGLTNEQQIASHEQLARIINL